MMFLGRKCFVSMYFGVMCLFFMSFFLFVLKGGVYACQKAHDFPNSLHCWASDLNQDAGSQDGLAASDHGPKSLVPTYGSAAEC